MADFLEKYSASITKMGAFPDKLVINKLTMLAHDVLNNLVPGVTPQDVANLLQKRILRADAKCKVPILFLIDSIFHNVNGGYIQLFSGNLCTIYHDAYREVNEKDRTRMIRLLRTWEKRVGQPDQIDPAILQQIRARLNPNWRPGPSQPVARAVAPNVAMPAPARGAVLARNLPQQQSVYNTPVGVNYYSYAAHHPRPNVAGAANVTMRANSSYAAQAQPSSAAQFVPSVSSSVSHHAQPIVNVNPQVNVAHNVAYDQAQYELVLRATAEQLLATLQSQMVPPIPENQRYTLDRVKQERAELYLELFQNARASLAEKGAVCWDVRYMQSAQYVSSVVVRLLKLGSATGRVKDEDANLLFASEEFRAQYAIQIAAAKKALEESRSSVNAQLKSRNWFQAAPDWCSSKPWEGIVDRVFSATADTSSPSPTEPSLPATPSSKKAKVIADDAYKSCPLCGEEFEKVWDDEVNDWIYANAVRPDPNGPIYMEKAYLKRSASMDLNSPAKRRRVLPGV